jgi:hypothetical protein
MILEKKLPSGAILKFNIAPFAEGKALYQAVLEEFRGLKLDPLAEIDVNLFKDLFCVALSSSKIEAALNKCIERALYNDLKIGKDTFEDVEARQDYIPLCFEIAKENIAPFAKSLYAEYKPLWEKAQKAVAQA